MRHRVYGYKLGRDTEHRTAMFRNMVAGLFEHGQITTTVQKAKAVQPLAEKLITLAKRGDLHARRRAVSILRDRIMCDDPEQVERNRYGDVVKGPKLIRHLFEEIGPRFAERNGGYTRIVRLGECRLGDGGDLVMLQLVGDESGPEIGGLGSSRKRKAQRRSEFAASVLPTTSATAADPTESDDAAATAVAVEEDANEPAATEEAEESTADDSAGDGPNEKQA